MQPKFWESFQLFGFKVEETSGLKVHIVSQEPNTVEPNQNQTEKASLDDTFARYQSYDAHRLLYGRDHPSTRVPKQLGDDKAWPYFDYYDSLSLPYRVVITGQVNACRDSFKKKIFLTNFYPSLAWNWNIMDKVAIRSILKFELLLVSTSNRSVGRSRRSLWPMLLGVWCCTSSGVQAASFNARDYLRSKLETRKLPCCVKYTPGRRPLNSLAKSIWSTESFQPLERNAKIHSFYERHSGDGIGLNKTNRLSRKEPNKSA